MMRLLWRRITLRLMVPGYSVQVAWEMPKGISLHGGSNVTIKNMEIRAFEFGVFLNSRSSNNTINGNNITNNGVGILVYVSSFDNAIYHNNFIGNTQQVLIATSGQANFWDDGYPSGGNYWSDCEDRYPNAEEIDDSGIWDTPYVIDENNQDNYPLVPEFPSFLILPLFMTATLLAVVVYRRKHST